MPTKSARGMANFRTSSHRLSNLCHNNAARFQCTLGQVGRQKDGLLQKLASLELGTFGRAWRQRLALRRSVCTAGSSRSDEPGTRPQMTLSSIRERGRGRHLKSDGPCSSSLGTEVMALTLFCCSKITHSYYGRPSQ